jgi:uncharacterized protein
MAVESAYIDTSVLGAYYCPEPLSAAADAALREIEAPVISNLTLVEFSSLIARKRQLKELDTRRASEVSNLFGTHVEAGFYRRISLGAEHFVEAQHLIQAATVLRTLDSLHLAAAIIEEVPILTADGQLASAARKLKARVILVS